MKLTQVSQAYLAHYPAGSTRALEDAYEFAKQAHAGQRRASGEAYIQHPLHTALTLAQLGLDQDTLIAALLHDTVEDNPTVTLATIEKRFGANVVQLVDAVTKLSNRFERVHFSVKEIQIESLRKLFLAMAQDIRVVLIKLADRLHNMRTINALSARKRKRIAQETLDIYAPLADRLGIFDIKWQLEDLSFAVLKPQEYAWIKKEVQERRSTREKYAEQIARDLTARITKAGIPCEAQFRVKHFYSIYKKAVMKYDRDVSRVYDLIAVRVVVDTTEQCYAALGIIHQLWKPLVHRIKDYIAIPKLNNYQALHTTVFAGENRLTEIQIQTRAMYQESEFGIAAHWNYKEQPNSGAKAKTSQLRWINQIAQWHQKLSDSQAFFEAIRTDVFKDKIFVFTHDGSVIDLPIGASAIDLAYEVNTTNPHQLKQVKINDQFARINRPLANGDMVELLYNSAQDRPDISWLRFVVTKKARAAISDWYDRLAEKETIELGEKLMTYTLENYHKPGLASLPAELWTELLTHFHLTSREQLYKEIAHNTIRPADVVRLLHPADTARQAKKDTYTLAIKAKNRSGILREILGILSRMQLTIYSLQTHDRVAKKPEFFVQITLVTRDKGKIAACVHAISRSTDIISVSQEQESQPQVGLLTR